MWRSNKMRNLTMFCFENFKDAIVLDVETTGLNAEKDRIIQFSGIKYEINKDKTLVEKSRFNTYINPERNLPEKIVELTGITDEMLRDAPVESVAFEKIFEFLKDAHIIIAYNSKFDLKFLRAMYDRAGESLEFDYELDVLEMARDLVSKQESGSHKLVDIVRFYGLDTGLQFHNSMDDVIATGRVVNTLYKEYVEMEEPIHGNIVPVIQSVNYWQGFRGMSRIYIHTNIGVFFYDVRQKAWNVDSKRCPYHIEEIDMESLKMATLQTANTNDEIVFVSYYRNK